MNGEVFSLHRCHAFTYGVHAFLLCLKNSAGLLANVVTLAQLGANLNCRSPNLAKKRIQ